jgi:hypothetical protein
MRYMARLTILQRCYCPPKKDHMYMRSTDLRDLLTKLLMTLLRRLTPEEKAAELKNWGATVIADLRRGESSDLIGMALVDTVQEIRYSTLLL